MKRAKSGLSLALREFLLEGKPVTRLEAMNLFGVQNLPDDIKRLRMEGFIVKKRDIRLIEAITRLKNHMGYESPRNLPASEIVVTEYRISR
jgi:hypothetical protein